MAADEGQERRVSGVHRASSRRVRQYGRCAVVVLCMLHASHRRCRRRSHRGGFCLAQLPVNVACMPLLYVLFYVSDMLYCVFNYDIYISSIMLYICRPMHRTRSFFRGRGALTIPHRLQPPIRVGRRVVAVRKLQNEGIGQCAPQLQHLRSQRLRLVHSVAFGLRLQAGDEGSGSRFSLLLMIAHHLHHVPILDAHNVPHVPARHGA